MQYRSNKGYTGIGQIGILIAMLGVGLILTTATQFFMGLSIVPPGTPFEKVGEVMIKALKNPAHINLMRWMQVLSTTFLIFIPALLYNYICNGKEMIWLGFNRFLNPAQVGLGFLLIFLSNIMAGPLMDGSKYVIHFFPSLDHVAARMENAYNDSVAAMTHIGGIPDLLISLLVMAFLPAMFEEIFFRGVLQNLLSRWWRRPLVAVIVVSVLFSMTHFSIYLFLTRVIMGFALGYMYMITRNLWVNIIAHFLNNAIVVIQLYAMSSGKNKVKADEIDPHIPWWLGIVAALVFYYLIQKLKENSERSKMKIYAQEQALETKYKEEFNWTHQLPS